jgi:plasmid stabilization system protein ParE
VDYIRSDNPTAATKMRRELQSAMQRLANFPEIGHFRTDLADESMRVWLVYSYLIYRPLQKPIEILRVIHGARDLRRFVFGA